MNVGFTLTLISLFFLSACTHSKKQSSQSAPPAPVVSAAPQGTAPQAPATESKVEKNILTCKRDTETRSLEIEALTPKGCKLWYTKDGNRNSVASSSVGSTHCENVQSRIQGKLEEAKFTCAQGVPPALPEVKK